MNAIDEIVHPAVRETFRFMDIQDGLEIHHDGDLPARSGLASSSAFTVGLLHALYALRGKIISKKRLALNAIHIEQEMIKENVGSQDQVIVAFGGLNKITFSGNHNIEVQPLTIGLKRLEFFQSHLALFFTGFVRTASHIEGQKIRVLEKKKKELRTLHGFVDEAIAMLSKEGNLNSFGKLLHESWKIKKSLTEEVSNSNIDEIYRVARKAGALGGKMIGAGGAGFVVFFVPPERRGQLIKALSHLLHVPFRFDSLGSQIIYYREES